MFSDYFYKNSFMSKKYIDLLNKINKDSIRKLEENLKEREKNKFQLVLANACSLSTPPPIIPPSNLFIFVGILSFSSLFYFFLNKRK